MNGPEEEKNNIQNVKTSQFIFKQNYLEANIGHHKINICLSCSAHEIGGWRVAAGRTLLVAEGIPFHSAARRVQIQTAVPMKCIWVSEALTVRWSYLR